MNIQLLVCLTELSQLTQPRMRKKNVNNVEAPETDRFLSISKFINKKPENTSREKTILLHTNFR